MLREPSIEASLYQGKKEGLRLEGHHIQQDLFNRQVKWDLEVDTDRMFKMMSTNIRIKKHTSVFSEYLDNLSSYIRLKEDRKEKTKGESTKMHENLLKINVGAKRNRVYSKKEIMQVCIYSRIRTSTGSSPPSCSIKKTTCPSFTCCFYRVELTKNRSY